MSKSKKLNIEWKKLEDELPTKKDYPLILIDARNFNADVHIYQGVLKCDAKYHLYTHWTPMPKFKGEL